ncbi:aspartyl-phosphate phosphatase Spo0E family protein [Mesobacillus foraminis]|uniref:aspartyl-phosphate phosphatase Spo0E family protein n=1 Tax=Mesobacillus foraminis TaxID=279826 RepID=UPI001BEB9071|nr:aspartyl-phosphate phosphatase Spo0E family protein [Mesobacillus foraminis]MBT2759045.1 aspartyl-phosphate phosphatase Spo0E family protein [Mesobacillus foraminis]
MRIKSIAAEESELVITIETLRRKMVQTGMQEGLGSKNTLTLSRQLDDFITKYQKHGFIETI